ncbi:MAG: hypothetical protein QOF64_3296 [Candidatus Binatota bacterium]|nr:hypothetical protein [Candidatus Binatota bacterium]
MLVFLVVLMIVIFFHAESLDKPLEVTLPVC